MVTRISILGAWYLKQFHIILYFVMPYHVVLFLKLLAISYSYQSMSMHPRFPPIYFNILANSKFGNLKFTYLFFLLFFKCTQREIHFHSFSYTNNHAQNTLIEVSWIPFSNTQQSFISFNSYQFIPNQSPLKINN